MFLYRTIARETSYEFEVQRSKFIAHGKRIDTREEAEEFLAEIRSKYRDATHNVPAFIIGNNQEVAWTSDDGEPQGTAGPPLLQLLQRQKLTRLCLVVTRYFGGVKLGTGGLVRAYSQAGQGLLEKAGIVDIYQGKSIKTRLEYSDFNKLTAFQFSFPTEIKDVEYLDKVACKIFVDDQYEKDLLTHLKNITRGQGEVLEIDDFLWEQEEK